VSTLANVRLWPIADIGERSLSAQSGRTNFPKADVAMINRFPLKQQSSVA